MKMTSTSGWGYLSEKQKELICKEFDLLPKGRGVGKKDPDMIEELARKWAISRDTLTTIYQKKQKEKQQ